MVKGLNKTSTPQVPGTQSKRSFPESVVVLYMVRGNYVGGNYRARIARFNIRSSGELCSYGESDLTADNRPVLHVHYQTLPDAQPGR